MASESSRRKPSLSRAAEHVFVGVGGGIAGTVYGTVVTMATLTAAYATEKHPWKLAGIVVTTSVVLWIAHIYAHGLAASIEKSGRLRRSELAALLRRELGIVFAAAAPTVALLLGAAKVFTETRAIWLALAIGLVTLGVEGLRFARLEKLGTLGTLVAVSANLALGLAIVALKVEVAH